jgi:hypothetical protein
VIFVLAEGLSEGLRGAGQLVEVRRRVSEAAEIVRWVA